LPHGPSFARTQAGDSRGENDRASRPDQPAGVFCRRERAPEAQVERLPRACERGRGNFTELQTFAGGEHQMIECADAIEQAAHGVFIQQIKRAAFGAAGQSG
jgi:hypothetical protein